MQSACGGWMRFGVNKLSCCILAKIDFISLSQSIWQGISNPCNRCCILVFSLCLTGCGEAPTCIGRCLTQQLDPLEAALQGQLCFCNVAPVHHDGRRPCAVLQLKTCPAQSARSLAAALCGIVLSQDRAWGVTGVTHLCHLISTTNVGAKR